MIKLTIDTQTERFNDDASLLDNFKAKYWDGNYRILTVLKRAVTDAKNGKKTLFYYRSRRFEIEPLN